MIEVSEAQVAPMSPNSRLRPTSAGLTVAAGPVSVAMIESFFLSILAPRGAPPAAFAGIRGLRAGFSIWAE
jgi:hypothetical protein